MWFVMTLCVLGTEKCLRSGSYRLTGEYKIRADFIVCRSIRFSLPQVSQRSGGLVFLPRRPNCRLLFHSMQIRSQSKASGSGLCEGDEVVSINGSPCADLTYPEVIKLMESVTDSLRMLVKRYGAPVGTCAVSLEARWGWRWLLSHRELVAYGEPGVLHRSV